MEQLKIPEPLAPLNSIERCYNANCGAKVIFKIGRCCPRRGVFQRVGVKEQGRRRG
jgi:Ni,Fe-hydrogenase III small subunit